MTVGRCPCGWTGPMPPPGPGGRPWCPVTSCDGEPVPGMAPEVSRLLARLEEQRDYWRGLYLEVCRKHGVEPFQEKK